MPGGANSAAKERVAAPAEAGDRRGERWTLLRPDLQRRSTVASSSLKPHCDAPATH